MRDISLHNDMNTNSLLKDKLEQLKGISKRTDGLSDEKRADIEKAARGFESMFVHMMMKSMKGAMLDKESQADNGFGASPLLDYTDMLISDEISKTGSGIGIADLIFRQLTGGESLGLSTSGLAGADLNTQLQNIPTALKNYGIDKESFLGRVSSRIGDFEDVISDAANKNSIPSNLIKAIITVESAGKPNAKSHAGAKGLMQLMDGTASDLGVKNSFDPIENINGGSKYLSMMLDRYDGDMELALAAYNAGPGNVDKYGGIPPFRETQNYVKKVQKYLNEFNKLF